MGETVVFFEGETHGVSPLQGGEFSLCGDAYDAHASEGMPELKWEPRRDLEPISCPSCRAVINACHKLRTAHPRPGQIDHHVR